MIFMIFNTSAFRWDGNRGVTNLRILELMMEDGDSIGQGFGIGSAPKKPVEVFHYAHTEPRVSDSSPASLVYLSDDNAKTIEVVVDFL